MSDSLKPPTLSGSDYKDDTDDDTDLFVSAVEVSGRK